MRTNYMQVMPCKHCGKTNYHLWAGEGLCPGITEGVEKLYGGNIPESMYYYQTGFKAGWREATAALSPQPKPKPAGGTDAKPKK